MQSGGKFRRQWQSDQDQAIPTYPSTANRVFGPIQLERLGSFLAAFQQKARSSGRRGAQDVSRQLGSKRSPSFRCAEAGHGVIVDDGKGKATLQSALPLTKYLHHRCVILGLESLHGFRLLGNGLSFGMGVVGGVAAEL